jgi:hypothetical protein
MTKDGVVVEPYQDRSNSVEAASPGPNSSSRPSPPAGSARHVSTTQSAGCCVRSSCSASSTGPTSTPTTRSPPSAGPTSSPRARPHSVPRSSASPPSTADPPCCPWLRVKRPTWRTWRTSPRPGSAVSSVIRSAADLAVLRINAPFGPRPGGFEAFFHAGSLEFPRRGTGPTTHHLPSGTDHGGSVPGPAGRRARDRRRRCGPVARVRCPGRRRRRRAPRTRSHAVFRFGDGLQT